MSVRDPALKRQLPFSTRQIAFLVAEPPMPAMLFRLNHIYCGLGGDRDGGRG